MTAPPQDPPRGRLLRLLLVASACAACTSACTAQRLVAPPLRAALPVHAPGDAYRVTLERFHATYPSEADTFDGRLALQDALMTYVAAHLPVTTATAAAPLSIEALVEVAEDTHRTIVLDIPFFWPLSGVWPFNPAWGDAYVAVTLAARLGSDRAPQDVAVVRARAPYSMIAYTFYRTAPIEDAFRRAYATAFEEAARDLAEKVAARRRRNEAEQMAARTASAGVVLASTGARVMFASAMTPEPPLEPPLAKAYLPEPDPIASIEVPEDGTRILFEPIARDDAGVMMRYLYALGGVEAATFQGGAHVESVARTRFDSHELVASGNAVQSGYRFSLFRPPDRTGFFFPPSIGFLSQTIEIRGFREDVPLSEVSGSDTIPAVASDPATGLPVDANEPISYFLRLKSGFLGQGVGANLVWGDEDFQIFGTLRGSVNLLEVRYADVTINQSQVTGTNVVFFKSFSTGAQLGFAIPSWHVAIRAAAELEWYLEFDYPNPVEFQAHVAFNPEKEAFERERVFVTGASLRTYNYQLSAVVLF